MHNADVLATLRRRHLTLPRTGFGTQTPTSEALLLAGEYKDRYEISYYLECLANLFAMKRGGAFSPQPFLGLRYKRCPLCTGQQRLLKGLAVRWLSDNAPSTDLRQVIDCAYKPGIRNLLGGHNSYRFDAATSRYVSLDGSESYTLQEVRELADYLDNLQTVLTIEVGRTYYVEFVPTLRDLGILDVRWVLEGQVLREVGLLQCWANLHLRDSCCQLRSLAVLQSPVRHGGGCSITFMLDDHGLFPYDLRVSANAETLAVLKKLACHDTIRLTPIAVAPPIPDFVRRAQGFLEVASRPVYVLSSMSSVVRVRREPLLELVDDLESWLGSRNTGRRCRNESQV